MTRFNSLAVSDELLIRKDELQELQSLQVLHEERIFAQSGARLVADS